MRAWRVAGIVAVAAAAALFAIELWTIVPAPTLTLLALAVVVPELAPWGVVAASIVLLAAMSLRRGRLRTSALALGSAALACALVPLLSLPVTLANAETEMRRALGATPVRASGLDARRAYDVRTSLWGFPQHGPVRVDLGLPVITRDGTRLALDLYRPATLTGLHPALLTIYGGAWIFGSRADSAQIGKTFAPLGYTVVALDYRHAPQFRFPTQLDDIHDALATVARHAATWNIDPARVALFGRSAGAQLALLAAYAPEPLTVRAAIGYYAPTDLVAGYRDPPRPDPADIRRILRAYLGGTPQQQMSAYVAASPIAHVRAGLPPTLLIVGGRDALVRPSFQHELRDELRARGVRVAAIDLPWSNHVFDALPSGLGGQIARYETERFLAAFL